MKKGIAILLSLVMMLALFAGCGAEEKQTAAATAAAAAPETTAAPAAEPAEKVVTVAISGTNGISTMDATYSMTDILHYALLYDGLVQYGENGVIEPALAERWEVSEDGLTYTFYLRQGVLFSDGTPFNADVVIFNTDRWKDNPNVASVAVGTNLVSTEKVDDYTVRMTFSEAYYPYLTELSYPRPCRMMSPSSVDAEGKFVMPIGTAMWMVDSFQENKETVLVPNPNYWGEKPLIDKLIIRVIPDAETRLMALQNGEIDFCAAPVPTESYPVVEGTPALKMETEYGTMGYHIIFNYDVPAFQNLQIRQAINYAVDKKGIVDGLLDGNGTPAAGLFPNTVAYVNGENNLGYEYDVEKAKALLAEAGCTDSDGDGILEYEGKPLSFRFVFQIEDYPEWKNVCEYISFELKEIGIDFKLTLQPSAEYYDTLWTTREFDAIMYRTYDGSWNPHGFIRGMYCFDANSVPVAWNSQELDEMIIEVLKTVDETARQEQYDAIFRYLYEEAVAVPVYYPSNRYAYNQEKLTGFRFADDPYRLIDWQDLDVIQP